MALDFTNSSWDFPVKEERIPHPTIDGQYLDNLKAIMNADTDEVLNVAGSGYTVLHNSSVVAALEDSVKAANISKDCEFSVRSTDSGKKMICEIIYPDVTIEPALGDYTQFRIRAFNSYDGTWPFSEMCDGVRLVCTNGMVSPRMISAARLRHTNAINIEGISQRIVKNFELFQNEREVYENMMKTKVDHKNCLDFFKQTVAKNAQKTTKEPFFLKQFTRLSDQLDYEFGIHGRTQWALYNCLTHWSTHTGEYANPEVTTRNREVLVKNAMKSSMWDELVVA